MTTYTVRNTHTMEPIANEDSLDAAEQVLEAERLAFLLNPPPDVDVLELVITTDEQPDMAGDIAVRYSAGRGRAQDSAEETW